MICDLVHFHGMGLGESLRRLLSVDEFAKRWQPLPSFLPDQVPKIVTVHGLYWGSNSGLAEAQRRYLSCFDTLVCVDRPLLSQVANLVGQGRSILYIPNSIDVTRFRPLPRPPGSELRVGFVGRLEASRGIDVIKEVAAHLPHGVRLQLAVSGSHEEYQRFSKFLEHRGVHCLVNVPQTEMPSFYAGIDLLLNPVRVPGISRATLEAMACGRPVAMFRDDSRYPVRDGINGFLLNSDENIAAFLGSLIGQHDRLARFGECARKAIESEFSNEKVLPRIFALYQSLARGESGDKLAC